MRVLVTGGHGFLGRRLQKVEPSWLYLSSKDCNLIDPFETEKLISKVKPDAIVHLAARVGGIKDNSEKQAEFFYKNVMINTNTIQGAAMNGIKRVLSCLSTCTFPDIIESYPMKEDDIFKGPPAETNFSYGFTKRMLHVQCLSYRKQLGLNYSTFAPSNLYGPEDHFDTTNSHFVASLVSKFVNAKEGSTLEFWGTGKPLRQQLYIDDLANLIPILLEQHDSDLPLIVAPNENLSIENMVSIVKNIVGKDLNVVFNGSLDGQYRKDCSNSNLINLIGEFQFTSFEDGVKKTIDWYKENRVFSSEGE